MRFPAAEKATTPSVMWRNSVESLLRSFSASEMVSCKTFAMWLKFRVKNANFILPLDFNALGKIARRNLPRTERERADGRNQNLGKKEGEDHADHKAEAKARSG